ncbi:MAG: YaiI/YqxD family protein [Pseudomonadota bacterium]
MHVWVDADACPNAVKEILFRASARTGTPVTLVANHPITAPRTATVRVVQVPQGADAADHEIVQRLAPGDLVITADIPLAADVIARDALALSPRGQEFTAENVRSMLNMRDFMETMRASGVAMSGGTSAFGAKDKQAFANALDRFLAQTRR